MQHFLTIPLSTTARVLGRTVRGIISKDICVNFFSGDCSLYYSLHSYNKSESDNCEHTNGVTHDIAIECGSCRSHQTIK